MPNLFRLNFRAPLIEPVSRYENVYAVMAVLVNVIAGNVSIKQECVLVQADNPVMAENFFRPLVQMKYPAYRIQSVKAELLDGLFIHEATHG